MACDNKTCEERCEADAEAISSRKCSRRGRCQQAATSEEGGSFEAFAMGRVALLAIAVVLVILLAVKPKKPQFDLQQVGVQYMGINPGPSTTADSAVIATPASAELSLNIRMLFTAVNPNKVGIRYGESRFTVMYKGIPLGRASVPGFYQDAHSQRQVIATIAVDRVSLMQADAADLIRDASLNDRVELRVLGDVGAKIRVMSVDSPGVEVSVDCAIVISPSKQSLTYKQCGFDGLSV
ncbi:hypothetical protein SAY87_027462 [Trapa incisa]|uniref:Late embryogenesis abundant protein LEA-2 subgroup domain-containing protein n=1 Tax=Trapa incisa TaxID=236973 RepID=A0AAN7GTP7_9MYRT|nr:hypothetical protein SAY87_027462 [Trapa incisa]